MKKQFFKAPKRPSAPARALVFSALTLALALTPGAALAKKKKAAEPAPVAAAAEAAPMAASAFVNNPEYLWHLDLSTGGRVTIQLFPNVAPSHVERIKTLTREGFYNGIRFHRVIDGFMAQTGDPTATGTGGSSLPDLKAEFNPTPHVRGVVSMARADSPDSANSQFFILFMPRFGLDKNYTAFGRVISGMQYVDAINRGEPPEVMTRIVQASIAADGKPVPPASMLTDAPPPAIITPPPARQPAPRSRPRG